MNVKDVAQAEKLMKQQYGARLVRLDTYGNLLVFDCKETGQRFIVEWRAEGANVYSFCSNLGVTYGSVLAL